MKTRCITLVVQFGKEGVDFGEVSDRLQALLYDNTSCEVVTATPGIARTREETPVPSFPGEVFEEEIAALRAEEVSKTCWCSEPDLNGLLCVNCGGEVAL